MGEECVEIIYSHSVSGKCADLRTLCADLRTLCADIRTLCAPFMKEQCAQILCAYSKFIGQGLHSLERGL